MTQERTSNDKSLCMASQDPAVADHADLPAKWRVSGSCKEELSEEAFKKGIQLIEERVRKL